MGALAWAPACDGCGAKPAAETSTTASATVASSASASAEAAPAPPPKRETLVAVVENLEALVQHLEEHSADCAAAVKALPAFHERSEALLGGRSTVVYQAIAGDAELNQRFAKVLDALKKASEHCREDPRFVELHEKSFGTRPASPDHH